MEIRACRLAVTALVALALPLSACGRDDADDGVPTAPGPALAAPASAPYAQPVAAGEGDDVASPQEEGRIIARSDFDTRRDGFSFENFGVSLGGPDIRAQEMREVFGDRVCADAVGPEGGCTLTPEAENWRWMASAAFNGGHCYGFAGLSLAIKRGREERERYGGAPSTWDLRLGTPRGLVTNAELHADLARGAALQLVPTVQGSFREVTATEALEELRSALPSGTGYIVAIFNPDGLGGHAVVPTAIEDLGDGQYDVHLYDNNHPFQPAAPEASDRRMRLDTRKDRWEYHASLNPDEDEAFYHGEGTTNRITLVREEDQRLPLPCPFCRGGAKRTEVSLSGDAARHGHLRITDARGRVTGFRDGRLVDEIPGAEVVLPVLNKVWLAAPEPRYRLPSGRRYTIELVEVPDGAPDQAIHATGVDLGVRVTGLTAAAEGTRLVLDARRGVTLDPSAEGAITGQLRVGAPGDRELQIDPSAARVTLRRAGGDVLLRGRADDVRVVDAARGQAAQAPRRTTRLDLDALMEDR